jgi:hypothetical protein
MDHSGAYANERAGHEDVAETAAANRCAEPEHGPLLLDLIAGFLAGCISRSLTAPAERVKTELQLTQGKEAGKVLDVSRRVWREAGVRGFFQGNTVNCLKVTPSRNSASHTGSHCLREWEWAHSPISLIGALCAGGPAVSALLRSHGLCEGRVAHAKWTRAILHRWHPRGCDFAGAMSEQTSRRAEGVACHRIPAVAPVRLTCLLPVCARPDRGVPARAHQDVSDGGSQGQIFVHCGLCKTACARRRLVGTIPVHSCLPLALSSDFIQYRPAAACRVP